MPTPTAAAIDRFLQAFADCDPKPEAGGYTLHCPGSGHRRGDRNRSLKVDYRDGKVLVHCHAGCATRDVLSARGLKLGDLFDEGAKPEPVWQRTGTYDYRDEQGAPLFRVERYDDANGVEPKKFYQFSPDGRGGWTKGLNGARRVPYRLNELLAHPGRLVFLTEGEKDADRLASLGFLATTNNGGAANWPAEYAEWLRDRVVVVLPDNDRAGFERVGDVADSLNGVARSVRVLLLPGLPPKGDVSDWLDLGGTTEELKRLAMAAPLAADWVRPDQEPAEPAEPTQTDGFTWLDDLLDEPDVIHRWLIDGLFTVGGLSLINARPKTGKSTLIRTLAAAIAAGNPVLGRDTKQGTVLLLCHEEQRHEIKLAFRRLGARRGLPIILFTDPAPERAVEWLRQSIEKYQPAIAFIDTLSAFFGITDINSNSEMTEHLKPVLALARESGTHICIVHWAGKGQEGPMGATSIFGTVDISLCITKDEDDHRIIYTEGQRSGTPIPKTILALDATTGASHLAGQLEWVQMETCAQAILDTLQKESMTLSMLEERVGRRAIVVGRTVREMHDRGFLVTVKEHGKTYYKVSPIRVPRPVFGTLGTTGTDGTEGTT